MLQSESGSKRKIITVSRTCVVAVILGVAFLFYMFQSVPISSQTGGKMAIAVPTAISRDDLMTDKLSSMFAEDIVQFSRSVMLPSRVENSTAVLVQFPTDANKVRAGGPTHPDASADTLNLLQMKESKGALVRKRSVDLSPDQMLMIAVNKNNDVLWWDLFADPRIVRAETSNEAGELSGQALTRANAEFLVSYPADETITELRFYHPDWDGRSYEMRLVGKLSLPSKN